MATTGKTDTTPYGLWLGGLFTESRRVTYRKANANQDTTLQVAKVHVNSGDVEDDYFDVFCDADRPLAFPKDRQILINVRARAKEREIRWSLATDFDFLTAPEVTRPDGEIVPARGVLIIGTFLGQIQQRVRDWDNPTPNSFKINRRLKFHLPRPVEPDHAEVDVPADLTLPTLQPKTAYLVPVSLFATKVGLGYRLVPSFAPMVIGGA